MTNSVLPLISLAHTSGYLSLYLLLHVTPPGACVSILNCQRFRPRTLLLSPITPSPFSALTEFRASSSEPVVHVCAAAIRGYGCLTNDNTYWKDSPTFFFLHTMAITSSPRPHPPLLMNPFRLFLLPPCTQLQYGEINDKSGMPPQYYFRLLFSPPSIDRLCRNHASLSSYIANGDCPPRTLSFFSYAI